MATTGVFRAHNVIKAIVIFFVGLAFMLLIKPYHIEEDGVFEIADPSRIHTFYDSTFLNADFVRAVVTGKLDGTATINIQYYPDTNYWVGRLDLKPGHIDSLQFRRDFYSRKIRIQYIPGTAENGYVKIVTTVL